ncbi:MAG: 23S rRNA (guanosine(2251)-2'-O)-methyltransferase RlmB [Candidatus Liptonbacteria bacterium]
MRRDSEKIYIYGKHALMEAISNTPRVVKKVFISEEIRDEDLKKILSKNNIPVSLLKNKEASRMVGQETAHQGVVAIVDTGALMVDFDEFVLGIKPEPETMLVLLDELTDPHNVGAIIRSAAAFGAAGVLIPAHNQAPITGAVVKSSAGMAFRVPLVSIGNVNYTVDRLKKMDFKVYALEMNGKKELGEEGFDGPALFVVGNEGKGIRQKTLERCDVALRIPMHPRCESLNASVSAAAVLYAWSIRHPEVLKYSKN